MKGKWKLEKNRWRPIFYCIHRNLY